MVSLSSSSRIRLLKLSTKPFCIDLPGAMSCHLIRRLQHHRRMALEVRAQIDYKRHPGSYGGKPSVVVDIEPVNAIGSKEPARPRPEIRCRRPR